MRRSSSVWTLFINILVTISIKKCEGICDNVNNRVLCTSVNEVSNVTLSPLEDISSVTEIEIRNNSELHLSASAFKSTVNLERVVIEFNNINNIFSDTFKDLPLKYVSIQYNNIKTIFPRAFSDLPDITKLILTGNNLKEIPRRVFSNLPIQELKLSKNNISTIEDMALENLPNLKNLKLDHNKLVSIFVHRILSYPTQLEILWLHNNSLTMVTNYMLQKLANLTVLNLGFNSISVIEPNSFVQTPKLGTLVLTHNQLKEIDGSIFPRTGLVYLKKLYLDNNKLMFLSSNFLFPLNGLRRITLVGNPWYCSCLNDVQILLAENKILEKCAEDYNNGKRPVCVSEIVADNVCRHTYNEALSEKYETYKKTLSFI
ncbi:hypothetical protein NQ314_020217 [Rhamnusium bicolor]|uniref:Uncharacterized protein n=1 Tax=Rhamnusium bicolor TaxID=1586634 RepID=A0AAV8WLI8_9CUCU|nr:hypothetical protein NQ314_020217 [Rhamnusium bicolor]